MCMAENGWQRLPFVSSGMLQWQTEPWMKSAGQTEDTAAVAAEDVEAWPEEGNGG